MTTSKRPRGFSLIDLLVAISVIAILLAISAPSLSKVLESARRVNCQSNLRQMGLGVSMFAEDHNGKLPESVFAEQVQRSRSTDRNPRDMQLLHLGGGDPNAWEGLGWLVEREYFSSWPLFYCPSHAGEHTADRYERSWLYLGDEIVGNYQYRLLYGESMYLPRLEPDRVIISDGLRTQIDYNHTSGNNMLRADLSVSWYDDANEHVLRQLPLTINETHRGFGRYGVWATLDAGRPVFGPETDPGAPTDASSALWNADFGGEVDGAMKSHAH